MDYNKGLCPNTEQLHYHEMTINEHIRLPNTQEDIDDIYRAIKKIIQAYHE